MSRDPVVAGRFYPNDPQACREELLVCLSAAGNEEDLPARVLGGVVPHAGWMFSGPVAARVLKEVAAKGKPEALVMFGAVHRWMGHEVAVYPTGAWHTPLGDVEVDESLAHEILRHAAEVGMGERVIASKSAHEAEHSLEVQMPFVRHLLPNCKVVPLAVPAEAFAPDVGRLVAEVVLGLSTRAVAVGTTDLTHYGPSYGFEPEGRGAPGLKWAREVNDQRMIDLLVAMDDNAILEEARSHSNACGAGAIAATVAFSSHCGATKAVVLEHSTSQDVVRGQGGEDAVGYTGLVFGSD